MKFIKLLRIMWSRFMRKKNPILMVVYRKRKHQEENRLVIANQKKYSKDLEDVKAV